MKKLTAIILVILMVTTMFVACGQQTQPEPPAPPANGGDAPGSNGETTPPADTMPRLGAAMIDIVNPFFVEIIEAGNMAAYDFGVTINWYSAEGSLDRQITIVENLIEAAYDVILVDAIDTVGIAAVVARAVEAGIPVVSMAQLVETATVCTLFNDFVFSQIQTEILWHSVGQQGTLGLIFGISGNFGSDERQRGFNAVADRFGITTVQAPMNFNPDEAYVAAAAMLAGNPDLSGIFCISDASTLAVLSAVQDAGREGEVGIVSNDGTLEGCEAVRDGDFISTVLMGPRRVGYWNVMIAAQIAHGETFDFILYLPQHLIATLELQDRIVNEWGMDVSHITMVTPEEGLRLNHAYREEFGGISG